MPSEQRTNPIRILIVEDFHAETDLLMLELRESETVFETSVASSEDEYRAELRSFQPDVILSPYSLRKTNALKLLGIARAEQIDSPFILLAYDLSEDIAIDLLGQGIEDYVLRSTLKRLPVAIRKALQRHKTQLELQLSEARLRASETSLRNMVRNAPIAVAMFDNDMNYLVVSETWLKHEKKSEEELLGNNHYDVVPEIPENWKAVHQKCLAGETLGAEFEKMTRADGSVQFLRWKMNPWYDSNAQIAGAVLFIEDITEKHLAQSAIEHSEATLRDAQRLGKLGSWEMNLDTNELSWSDEMFSIHGLKKQRVSIELFLSTIHVDDIERVKNAIEIAFSGGSEPMEYRIIRSDNKEERLVLGSGARIIGNRLMGTIQDITEQHRTALDLKKSEASLKLAQQIARIGNWEWERGGKTVWCSDEMYSIYEIEKRTLTVADIRSFIHPDDLKRVERLASKDLTKDIVPVIDYRIITPTGKLKHVASRAKQVLDDAGTVIQLVGTLQDVTERRVIEEELERKELLFREMAENIEEVFWVTDETGANIHYMSPLYEKIYGRSLQELHENGDAWALNIHPDDKERVFNSFRSNGPKGKYDETYRLVHSDNSVRWVRARAFPIKDSNGTVVRLVGVTQDITEQKRDKDRIETLSLVASETINGVLIQDAQGRAIWANKGFTRITGYQGAEIIGKEPWTVVSGDSTNQKLVDMTYQKMTTGKAFSSENQLKRKDGELVWVNTSFTPVLDEHGVVKNIVSIGTDINKQKELEELQRNLLRQLEMRVKERVSELESINEELRTEAWEKQRLSDELYHSNLDLKDSIQYAKRIQESILPSEALVRKSFAQNFVLLLPRDVVSGDSYWHHRYKNLSFFAAIDCTGHGVPGALMSMIANELMNQTVIQKKLTDPAEILAHLNKLMVRTMRQKDENKMRDGMDLGLVVVNHLTNELHFSGALSSMYLIRNGDLNVISGNRHSVGGHLEDVTKEFETTTISLSNDNQIYLASDGYIDQFGGPNGKKLMKKRFSAILQEISTLPMADQKQVLLKRFHDWKGSLKQVDDVLVVGLTYNSNDTVK